MSSTGAARGGGTRTLSEAESTRMLAPFGVPFAPSREVRTEDEAMAAATEIGFPVVAKLNGEGIAHKTEQGLVRLGLADREAVRAAARELLDLGAGSGADVSVLVAPMLVATRELITGLSHDPQFGMTVMLGVGGILAEAIARVVVRLVPIDRDDALEMVEDLGVHALLGELRGEPAVDRSQLVEVLLALSHAATAHPEIISADLNPILVVDGAPIAVDALVEVRAQ